ncbi:restriction endonuclease subunit S [Sulfitobacter sp. 1A15333]|uniref:restriction endonuclease subunit S n=1 Tax=Sulfitobacter sp. 1A15333 TaxID=3368570 RepID=UPI0037475AED
MFETYRLGHLGTFSQSGIDKKSKDDEIPVKIVNYMDVYGNKKGVLHGEEFQEVTAPKGKFPYHLLSKGDVLITPSSETSDDIGHSAVVLEDMAQTAYSYHLVRFRPFQATKIIPEFSRFAFQARQVRAHLEKMSKGTTRKILTRKDFTTIPFMLPDLATQRQIADFLDRESARIDLLIEKKQRLVALLGEQRAAAISSAVTVGLDEDAELVTTSSQYLPRVPATWRVWRLKHLAEIRGGLTLGRQILDDVETTLTPYMRVANVQAGWLDLSDVAEIPVTEVEKLRYRLKLGDVLMNEGGDNDKLGRGAVWKSEIETCVHQNHVFAVRPHDTRYSDWISLATNARYARDFFYLHSNQSTNLASISKTNLARFPVAFPPMDEMRATLDALWQRVVKLDQISEKTDASIERLKEYRAALITAAVTGQIDVSTYAKSGTPDRRLDAIQEEMGA